MTRAFVTGFPIKHSMSPRLHGFWLKEYGIDGTYDPVEVEPEAFTDFLGSIQKNGFAGGNITLPHKEAAHQLVDKRDGAAEQIGAVNTVWLEGDQLCGGNTDAYGFAANLDDFAGKWRDGKTALVLGAGGASRAVIHAILEAGFDRVDIINRTVSRAEALAERFGSKCHAGAWNKLPELLPNSDLLVNTTSLGMSGHGENTETPLPDMSLLQRGSIVTDIVYTPLETPILEQASKCGHTTVDGLGMLLHQAAPGFERWFGVRPKVTSELRQHILEVLG